MVCNLVYSSTYAAPPPARGLPPPKQVRTPEDLIRWACPNVCTVNRLLSDYYEQTFLALCYMYSLLD